MKYIDADKLIAEIERFKTIEYGDNTFGDDVANGALDYVLEEIIPSLQQEQPEVDLGKEMDKLVSLEYVNQQDDKWEMCIAHHFYELGKNARKEE